MLRIQKNNNVIINREIRKIKTKMHTQVLLDINKEKILRKKKKNRNKFLQKILRIFAVNDRSM